MDIRESKESTFARAQDSGSPRVMPHAEPYIETLYMALAARNHTGFGANLHVRTNRRETSSFAGGSPGSACLFHHEHPRLLETASTARTR